MKRGTLPLGTSDFRALRLTEQVYVDKTDFVYDLEIRNLLSEFFLRVKSSDGVWRFIFITDVAKFNKARLFSAFNNLKDISLDPEYGTLPGYTENEILENVMPFVGRAAQANGMDVPALMAAMKTRYDGFREKGRRLVGHRVAR